MTNENSNGKALLATVATWNEAIQKKAPAYANPNYAERLIMSINLQFHKVRALNDVDPATLKEAILDLASLGLILGGRRGQAFLIPYKSKCELVIGYPGIIDLLSRNPNFKSIIPDVVYKGDELIEKGGTHRELIHNKTRAPEDMTEENITHFYAVINFKEGSPDFKNLYRKEVDSVKHDALQKYNKYPEKKKNSKWVTNYPAMGMKTAILRLGKYMPSNSIYEKMMQIDDKYFEKVEEQKTWDGDYRQDNSNEFLIDKVEKDLEHND